MASRAIAGKAIEDGGEKVEAVVDAWEIQWWRFLEGKQGQVGCVRGLKAIAEVGEGFPPP